MGASALSRLDLAILDLLCIQNVATLSVRPSSTSARITA